MIYHVILADLIFPSGHATLSIYIDIDINIDINIDNLDISRFDYSIFFRT